MMLAFALRDLLQNGFQPFLEFAAVLGAGQQRRHIERKHAFVLERFRHFAVDDTLRQSFDDRGLAHARLADQNRIILGAPLQYLDRAADFIVAPDYRIELAHARALGQVHRVFLQCFAAAFGFCAAYVLASPHRASIACSSAARLAPCCLQQIAGLALVLEAASRNISDAMN